MLNVEDVGQRGIVIDPDASFTLRSRAVTSNLALATAWLQFNCLILSKTTRKTLSATCPTLLKIRHNPIAHQPSKTSLRSQRPLYSGGGVIKSRKTISADPTVQFSIIRINVSLCFPFLMTLPSTIQVLIQTLWYLHSIHKPAIRKINLPGSFNSINPYHTAVLLLLPTVDSSGFPLSPFDFLESDAFRIGYLGPRVSP